MKINLRTLFLFSLLIALCSTSHAQNDEKNERLNEMIIKGMTDWKVPGLSVLVMKDGETVFKNTYGTKEIKTTQEANNQTLFTMASTTKALVAMGMAILVDEGKVNWEDKVRKHYPQFKLSDSYITEDARIKDLFTHNLGIGNADWIWYGRDLSTEETIAKFSLTDQAYPLRGGYQYQNMGYVIAGEVIKAISGKPWDQFIKENIFTPLGMTRTAAMSDEVLALGNVATPHFDDFDEGVIPIDYAFFDQAGAAGSIYSCIDDMEKYLTFIHNKGIHLGDTIINASTFEYLFQPKIIIENGFYPTSRLTKPHWKTYAMGWFQHDYKGEKVDFHTGSIDGLVAIHGWLRDQNLGVYVFTNLDHAELRHAIMYKVFDLYALGGDRDWHKEIYEMYDGFNNDYKDYLNGVDTSRVLNTSHSKPLIDYAGTYENEMLGEFSLTSSGTALNASLNNKFNLTFRHWHYDTFRSDVQPQWRSKEFITFYLNQRGEVEKLEFRGREYFKK